MGAMQGFMPAGVVLPEVWRQVEARAGDRRRPKGKPIIYEYGDLGDCKMGKFCENAFTYLKRVSLCTQLEGDAGHIGNVVKALNRIDHAHFKRLTDAQCGECAVHKAERQV
eukprot:4675435-Amphidinium_carterae.2